MMMRNYDELVEINYNSNWPPIPDNLYEIWIIGGSGSGKTNVLLNLIKHQRPDIGINLFMHNRSILVKVLIVYQWKR